MKRKELIARMTRSLDSSVEKLTSFSANINQALEHGNPPYYDFDNCDMIFRAAASMRVTKELIGALGRESQATKASILDHMDREIRMGAQNPKRSTSVTANFMASCLTEAWATSWADYAFDIRKLEDME